MAYQQEDDWLEDFFDGAVISVILPYFIVMIYKIMESGPDSAEMGLSYDLVIALFSLFLILSFLFGIGVATLRGGIFGAIGYFIGTYGANSLFTETPLAIALMFFGAIAGAAGASSRSREEFKKEANRFLVDLGL